MERHSRPRILNIWTVVTCGYNFVMAIAYTFAVPEFWGALHLKTYDSDVSAWMMQRLRTHCRSKKLCTSHAVPAQYATTNIGTLHTAAWHEILLQLSEC